jgi:hypothetical protein
MVLMNNLDLIASAPGTYDEGILIWRQSTGIFEGEIKYKNHFGDKGFCMLFMLYTRLFYFSSVIYRWRHNSF